MWFFVTAASCAVACIKLHPRAFLRDLRLLGVVVVVVAAAAEVLARRGSCDSSPNCQLF